MGIENLNGNILDKNGNPILNAKISLYRKIGEIFSDENGHYSNVVYNETEDYIINCSKEDFFDNNKEFSEETTNFELMKNDNLVEPPIPENIQVIDYQTGDFISLNWTNVTFDFLAGYNIYRSDDINGIFEKINLNIIVDNNYIDSNLETFKEYFYILEVVSANNPIGIGTISRSSIIGPITIKPLLSLNDITDYIIKLKVDSTKTSREAEKILDGNEDAYWESQSGEGSWLELIFDQKRNINGYYFKKPYIGKGILYATLQYWNYTDNDWTNIQNVNYLIDIEYTFENFLVNTDRIRLFISQVESLSETQISKIIVYGE
jgi:hypothetical protein